MLLESLNKRRVPRRPIELDLVDLELDGRTYRAQVSDVSAGGMGLVLRKSSLTQLNFKDEPVRLKIADQVFDGAVRYELRKERSVILGVSIRESDEDGIQFGNEDPDWDLIDDPETLEGIFEGLAFKGPEAPLTMKQPSGHALVLVEKYIKGECFEGEIFETEFGQLSEGAFRGEFTLYQTFNSFQAKIEAFLPKNRVRFSVPKFVARVLRRETVRVQSEEMPKIQFVESLFRDHGKIKLHDFSEQGFSFLDRDGHFSLPKGYDLGEVEIELVGGFKVKGTASVRSYRYMGDEEAYLLGINFEPHEASRTAWHNAVLKGRYPTLKFEYENQDHQGIWDLFERSGYLELKDPDSFSHVFDVTKKTWKKLADAGTRISKRAVIRQDGQIRGHLQMDRIYPNTWCAHHLAIDPNMSRMIGRELYSLTTDVLSAEGAKYVLSLTEASKPWNQRNYYDFVKQYRFPEHNELKFFEVFEFDTKQEHRYEPASNLQVKLANEWDRKRIVRFFELFGSELEKDALGLTSENLDLASLNEEYVPYGLKRKRDFLVAMAGDELLGIALLETGTSGVNIFGLLDMCYLYFRPGIDSARKVQVTNTLLSKALYYYKAAGVGDVIIAIPDADSKYHSEKGLIYIWKGIRWIGKCVAARRYHAYSQMLYGQLLSRREKIRRNRLKNPV